ncbi:MAG TPA: right-handed parallel beta-helix repeat-containing protein [Usitatibacter sp.]|jgi:hypothetical protein|nr:right-handed parallel beta-helix repeat-containing protein [Usitatibacter sp.]
MPSLLSRIVLVLACALLPPGAHAQAFRAYIASYGVDTNPCTVAAPCRLLPAALAAVHDGGEIWMLDSANFNSGTVNVTKNVKILAIPGQIGSVAPVAANPAMVIAPGLTVSLRNMTVMTNANNPGTDGIRMTTGSLSVEDSVFEVNVPGQFYSGILVTGTGVLSVHGSVFRNGAYGVFLQGGAQADIWASRFFNFQQAGVYVFGSVAGTTSSANVRDSSFSGGAVGAMAEGQVSGSIARLAVTGCSFSNAQYGVASQTSVSGAVTTVTVASSTITYMSQSGVFNLGAGTSTLESQGNNTVRGNVFGPNNGSVTTISGF